MAGRATKVADVSALSVHRPATHNHYNNRDGLRPPAPTGGLELGVVAELWPALVDAVRVDDDVLAMCLTEARPVDCAERSLVIAFHPDDTMRRRKAESARARQVVAEALRSLTGVAPQISVEARELDPAVEEAPADPEAELLERLKAEFDAEEILDDPDQEGAA